MASDHSYKLFSESNKPLPRVASRREWPKQKDPALRRTPHLVEIDITPVPYSGFRVEGAGITSFAVGECELRRWPAFRRRIEAAIGCRVAAMTQAEWEWTVANRGLAPMTPAAEAWREADLEQFDCNFEKWCEYQQAAGADMARRRAEGRRS